MKRLLFVILPFVILGAAISFFSPLRVFNALTPVDGGTERILSAAAYGNDLRQRLDAYRPTGGSGLRPVLIFSYGGAWSSGDRGSYEFIGRALAAQGYVAIVYDYRLVPAVRFPAFVEDTAAVIAWAVANGQAIGGDPTRIFLAGHSAGAYNVALVGLDASYLAARGVDPAIIKGVAVLAGPLDFLPLDDAATFAAFSHWPDPAATQPVNHVTAAAPPFLLLTGAADATVYPRNSRALATRLARAGVRHRLIEYPGIGHAEILLAVARPLRWRAPVLADIVAFFAAIQAEAKSS